MTPDRDDLAQRLALLVVTDRRDRPIRDLEEIVEQVLGAGAPALQLREKQLPPAEVLPLARRLRTIASAAGALFFVNDRLDLALASDADGVHLGPDDLPVDAARRMAPPPFLIGCSARTPEAACAAAVSGADYIGCGSVFLTHTKIGTGAPIGLAGLAAVARSVEVPVLGIGGIGPLDVACVADTGAAGCAIAGAVMHSPDPAKAVRGLLAAANAAAPNRNAPPGQVRAGRSSSRPATTYSPTGLPQQYHPRDRT